MKIFVLNAGSSSCKYQLFDMDDKSVLCSGIVERIGEEKGTLTHKVAPDSENEEKICIEKAFPTHTEAMEKVIELLLDKKIGVIKDKSEVSAIGHRLLHGGEEIFCPVLIDDRIKKIVRKCFRLGPLHNPANLMGVEVAEKLFPKTPNVGVFDTEFGMTMPQEAFMYALPYEYYEELKIRRYGFHGTSHKYVTKTAAKFLNKPLAELNCINMHLGNGSSMTAVKNGICIDTSMGLTPLEGLIMGTRCGSIDPAIVPFIMEGKGLNTKEVDSILNKKSGLLGICGTNDMRDLHTKRLAGDTKAQLAFNMLVRSIKKILGSYFFLLDANVDAIVFTAGIGENDEYCRAAVCSNLERLGIKMDMKENNLRKSGARSLSLPDSNIQILIIPTNEELQIAETTLEVLKNNN